MVRPVSEAEEQQGYLEQSAEWQTRMVHVRGVEANYKGWL